MNKLDAAIAEMPHDLIQGTMCDRRGKYCAVGFLGHKLGWTDDELRDEIRYEDLEEGEDLEEAVAEAYGLNETVFATSDIIQYNDVGEGGEKQRTRVISILSEIRGEVLARLDAKRAR